MPLATPSRRALLAGGLAALAPAALAPSARAQAPFPSRPVRIVVPYPAGGPTDVIARLVAQALGGPLGTNVVVENVAGASGALGTAGVAKAEPDGHVIVFGNNQTHGSNGFLLKQPGYDAVKDFAPLVGVGAFEHAFVARADLPASGIQDLVRLAKAEPDRLNYGSTGVGSGSHLSTELFMARTGARMTHVPFRGAAPLVNELLAGRIDVANSTLPSVIEQVRAGTLKALALSSPRRNPGVPDVPTLREQGVLDADAESWTAFFAPAATPGPVLERWTRELTAALSAPAMRAALERIGFTLEVRDPAAFAPYHLAQIEEARAVIKAAGLATQG